MHVLQVIDSISMGGAERLLITFARQAGRHQIQTSIIGLQDDSDNPILDDLKKMHANIKQLPAKRLFSPKRLYKIIRFIRDAQVDVIQTHLTYANILGGLAGWLTKTPVAATLHSIHFQPTGIRGLRDKVECWVLRHLVQDVIAVGKSVEDSYRPVLGGKPIRIIRNAVCPAKNVPEKIKKKLRVELAISQDKPIILAVGRTVPAKGYLDLIKAVRMLHPQAPDAHLVIIGDGTLFQDLKNFVVSKKLSHFIHFLGERKDVAAWLAVSDIFVSSSHWEGLPLAVLEAMMAGLPIVATSVGELPEVISPEIGFLVPSKKPKELSKALISLLNDPLRRSKMGMAAQKKARLEFSADLWFNRMMDLFQQMVKENR